MSTTAPDRWRLYTVDDVAQLIDKSKSTVYRLVKAGLPHHNIMGTGIRFTESDIERILARAERGRR